MATKQDLLLLLAILIYNEVKVPFFFNKPQPLTMSNCHLSKHFRWKASGKYLSQGTTQQVNLSAWH